jgi:hypothetical protein
LLIHQIDQIGLISSALAGALATSAAKSAVLIPIPMLSFPRSGNARTISRVWFALAIIAVKKGQWGSLNCGGSLVLYELAGNGYRARMVVFCSGIVGGILVAGVAGLFWLKIAGPAWHDFNQARKPHLPRSPSTA